MALEKIGPYKFQGILGRGGMGTVYRGVHEVTGEVHAIKVLAPTYAHDDHFRGRFESEIKALIKLDHKNIVRLLSYGQEDGMLFFAMELVEGNSLFQMQKKGHRFDWREILSIAKDVCHGLRHAHDRGIIHRDLKPGNLLMTTDDGKPDYVKITDFGIAKRFGNSQNTGENVLGTMDFMSPEQAKGEPVTIRSDLYSLGTVLFTLLSGKPPFTSNSVEESLRNLTRVPAPHVNSMVPDVPDELDDLIQRLMAKRPEQRIQTAQSLLYQIEEIENTLRDNSEAKTAHRRPPRQLEDTFNVQVPLTEKHTGNKQNASRTDGSGAQRQTIEFTDHDAKEEENRTATQIDYFNTVTDQVRQKQLVGEEHKPAVKGIWPIAMALAAVVLLGGYGIYQSFKAPGAEELFTTIELNADRPNRAMKEIDEFLKHYPDEPRAAQIKELKLIGEAINLYNSLYNTLIVRKHLPGENRLTEIEKQFLNIVDLAESDPALADAKMAAFITVHESTELGEHDQKCVAAAKGYKLKIENDARSKVLFNLTRIRAAMKTAAKTTDPEGAIPIYESILELYGKIQWGVIEEADEGRALVEKARDILIAMKAAKTQSEEDANASDEPNHETLQAQ